MITSIRSCWRRWWRWVAAGAAVAGAACFLLVAAVAWRGEPFALANLLWVAPLRYLALGAAAVAAACTLWLVHGCAAGNRVRAASRLVLLLVSLGLTLGLGECLLRVYVRQLQQPGALAELWRTRGHGGRLQVRGSHPLAAIIQPATGPGLAYELEPNLDTVFGPCRVHTNSDGMRADADYSRARHPRSVRIAGIGDSGMFGWDCPQDRTYLAVLERTLNARGDGVLYEVLNFGTPGYNTDMEVACLRAKGLAFAPDLVVVGWCANDYYLPMFVTQKEFFPSREPRLWLLLFDRKTFWAKVAGVGVVNRREGEFEMARVTEAVTAGLDVAGVRRALAELEKLGWENGFRILVFGPLDATVLALCAELGLATCNTLDRIPPGQYSHDWHVHEMHPSPDGHRVLGECLARELEVRGWLAPRDPAGAAAMEGGRQGP